MGLPATGLSYADKANPTSSVTHPSRLPVPSSGAAQGPPATRRRFRNGMSTGVVVGGIRASATVHQDHRRMRSGCGRLEQIHVGRVLGGARRARAVARQFWGHVEKRMASAAEGALEFLHRGDDVVGNRIFLQGWSNGGSTTLNGRTVFSLTSSRSRTPWLKREDERKGPVNWLKPRTAAYFLKPPGSVLTPPRHPPPDTLSSGSVAALRTGPACGRRWHRNWRRHWHSIGR